MIEMTKLNKEIIYINPHQIEFIQSRPDTTLSMLSGKNIVVRESYPDILEKIIAYRKQIGAFKNEE